MVKYGMDPMSALQSATVETAKLLDEFDNIGSISAGKIADIIAISGNPITNINNMENVVFVMKDGQIFFNEIN